MFFFLFTNGFQIGNAEQALLMENYFIRFTLISVFFWQLYAHQKVRKKSFWCRLQFIIFSKFLSTVALLIQTVSIISVEPGNLLLNSAEEIGAQVIERGGKQFNVFSLVADWVRSDRALGHSSYWGGFNSGSYLSAFWAFDNNEL